MTRQAVRSLEPAVAEQKTRYLYWWLLLSLFLEYGRPTAFIPGLGALPINSVVPLSLFAVSFLSKGLRSNEVILSDRLFRYPLFLVLLIAISVIHADVTRAAYEVFTTVLGYAILLFLIAKIATSAERIRGVFITLILAHIFLLAMNPEVITDPGTRHYVLGATFLGDGNDFSLSICILLPFSIELISSAKSRLKMALWGVVMLILVLALIGTQSRGATLGMGASLVYFWLVGRRKFVGIVLAIVAALAVLAYAPDVYFERMGTIASYRDEGSAMGRIEAWKAGLRMGVDNPILGVAAGHFPIAYGTKYRAAELIGTPWKTAHSMYVLVFGELGFPGLFLLLAIVIGNVRANARVRKLLLAHQQSNGPVASARESARMLRLLNGSMIGLAVAGAFLSVAYYPHLFVLTAILVSARSVALRSIGLQCEPGALLAHRRKVVRSAV
jgi:putative inorganic carbon (HCO3(-)) transporter